MPDDELTRTFPPDVFTSMRALRKAAGQARSLAEWRQTGRYATPEEIAASESLRTPMSCSAHSVRTGLACAQRRVHGMTCCRRHGGNRKRVRARAAQRLRELIMPVLERLYQIAMQEDNPTAAMKAAADLLDRAEVGALVAAKVRTSKKDRHGKGRMVVQIGFLQGIRPGDQPPTIVVPAKNEPESE